MNDYDQALQAYLDRFGSIVELMGAEYPEITLEMLREAVKTGQPIEPNPVEAGVLY